MVEVNAGIGRTNGDARPPADEHERSLAVADRAMDRIRTLKLPAHPRNYEIWFAYATGHYPTLNHAVDDLLARRGSLSGNTLEQLGTQYVSRGGLADHVDTVGSRVSNEIGHVIAAIDTTLGSANACAQDFASVDETLAAARDRNALFSAVEKMALAAGHLQDDRRRLEGQLNASRLEISQLRQELKTIRNSSLTDPLTGLGNRKSFEQSLAKTMAEAAQRGEPISLLMADIDNFKQFNDTWGHQTGDQVLRLVALEIKQAVTDRDIVARYGGEEFAVILPNSRMDAAQALANHIRRSIMSRDIISRSTGRNLGRFTVSFGVACMGQDDTPDNLVGRADACLYGAKCNGRNRVVSENDPEFAGFEVASAVA
jgi:diguanylate cyclase